MPFDYRCIREHLHAYAQTELNWKRSQVGSKTLRENVVRIRRVWLKVIVNRPASACKHQKLPTEQITYVRH